MDWVVPLSDLKITEEEKQAVQDILDQGWLSMGKTTQLFEEAFAKQTGARHAIAVSNGTTALHLACLVLGIGEGDEVIVPSLTFVATANAVKYTGAKPVFADIYNETDLTISHESIVELITPNTKAIIVMHYGGYPCNMPKIQKIATEHDLKIIEDAAHAPGASLNGQSLGTIGDIGCFSFFANKNLTTGEGGMITTNDDSLAEKMRLLRSHGMTTLTWDRHRGHAWSYDVIDLGFNYRIDEIRSALGIVQLKDLTQKNQKRKDITQYYQKLLDELSTEITLPFINHPGNSAHHIFPIVISENIDRSEFVSFLKEKGIQTSLHYPPIHTFSYYQNQRNNKNTPHKTELIAKREVTLPLYPGMGFENTDYVCEQIRSFLSNSSR